MRFILLSSWLLLAVTLSSSPASKPSSCCQKLWISGTLNQDPWYQSMMGVFTIYQELPWISYENIGEARSGKYPVYIHNFTDFQPTEERPHPPRVFLYYYYNEIPDYPEKECKQGCWIISMYEADPGNYWFGKKWYHIKNKVAPKCPDLLTEGNARFINQDGDIDPGLVIQCI